MLPSPVAVLTALFGDLPTILFHAKFTLLESFYGLLIGIALAFVFATMMDRFRVMDQAFYPIMIITPVSYTHLELSAQAAEGGK